MRKKNEKSLKILLIINLLLVMLLVSAVFIFMILLQSMSKDLGKGLTILIYAFIVALTLITAITAIMIFLLLSKRKIIR